MRVLMLCLVIILTVASGGESKEKVVPVVSHAAEIQIMKWVDGDNNGIADNGEFCGEVDIEVNLAVYSICIRMRNVDGMVEYTIKKDGEKPIVASSWRGVAIYQGTKISGRYTIVAKQGGVRLSREIFIK